MLTLIVCVTFYITRVKQILNLNNYFSSLKVLNKHYGQKNI